MATSQHQRRSSRRGPAPALGALIGGACLAPGAAAQFDPPLPSNAREIIAGEVLPGDAGVTPEPGDEIGALFEEVVIGRFVFTSTQDQPDAFEIELFGDDPNTGEVEGPEFGDPIEFQFYDSSTNTFLSMDVLNEQGEVINPTFRGEVFPDIPGLPIDLAPRRGLDLRIGGGVDDDDDDGGDGGGGGGGGGDPDVNQDGRIDKKDAAIVLQVVLGGARILSEDLIRRSDVNGDGSVTTADAAAILRKRPGGVRTPESRGSARSSNPDPGDEPAQTP
jgi:hypothetical protein